MQLKASPRQPLGKRSRRLIREGKLPAILYGHNTEPTPVTLDRLSIGNITERSVPALIAQPGQLRTNLLGMSFLNRLESWEVRGDKLMMRGKP